MWEYVITYIMGRLMFYLVLFGSSDTSKAMKFPWFSWGNFLMKKMFPKEAFNSVTCSKCSYFRGKEHILHALYGRRCAQWSSILQKRLRLSDLLNFWSFTSKWWEAIGPTDGLNTPYHKTGRQWLHSYPFRWSLRFKSVELGWGSIYEHIQTLQCFLKFYTWQL